MGGEWKRHEVSELIGAGCLFIGDGYRAKNEELGKTGLPFARAGNIRDGFQFDDADRFPEAAIGRVGNKTSEPGDVVFTSKGTVGRFAFVRADTPRFVYSPQLCFWRSLNRNVIEPRFLFYWMFGWEFNVQFKGVAGQTDMAEYVSLADQRKMHITLPPLPEQRAIAHILGTLDDKIECNRRMSQTLEAMARALFQAWFVDFEPVRAKLAGRWRRGQSLPGLPAHLYDRFPNRLVDSPLGPIPEGWEVGTLGDLADIQGGKQLPTQQCKPYEQFPVFGANGIMGFAARNTHEGFVIAFGRVGANCGSIHWTYGGAWINNNASSVVPKRWPEYVLQAMLATDFEGMRTGSAQPFIPNSALAAAHVLRAPDSVLDAFCAVTRPLRLRQHVADRTSRTLAALRDALLPKLISGQIRVKDAERFLKKRGLA
jgi:type I restriction enzyme S subunit